MLSGPTGGGKLSGKMRCCPVAVSLSSTTALCVFFGTENLKSWRRWNERCASIGFTFQKGKSLYYSHHLRIDDFVKDGGGLRS